MRKVNETKKHTGSHIALTLLVLGVGILPLRAAELEFAKAGSREIAAQVRKEGPVPSEIMEMRAKIAELENALRLGHQGQTGSAPGGGLSPGMQAGLDQVKTGMEMMRKGMKSMDGMKSGMPKMDGKPMGAMQARQAESKSQSDMGGMPMKNSGPTASPSPAPMASGMKMGMKMGRAKKSSRMKMMGMAGDMDDSSQPTAPSALPGFPGISHLYHIGSTGFFIDHGAHLGFNPEKIRQLNSIKERSTLEGNTFDRKIAEAEQELWTLTAADQPDAARVESKIREIEKLNGDRRLAFIRAVGEAANALTDEQRSALMGMQGHHQANAPQSTEGQ